MRRFIPFALLLLAACSRESEPATPALSFESAGGSYAWRVAHGASGGLLLIRETAEETGKPVLILTCDNLKTGGLHARLFHAEPTPTALELAAGTATMTVVARPGQVGDQPTLEGEGGLPPGWSEALGAAATLKLRYGDQGLEVQGPGPDLAANFGRYCRQLDDREAGTPATP